MIKQLAKDSVIYGAGRIVTYGVNLFLVPLYTRVFAPADYGTIDILNLLISLVNLTIALEIGQAIFRFLPDFKADEERISYASTALWFTVVVYSVFVGVIWLVASEISYGLLNLDGQQGAVRVAALAAWAGGIFLLAQSKLRAQLQPKAYSITNITFTLAYLVFAVTFVLVLHLGIIGVFWGQLIGSLIGCVLAIYYSRSDYRLVFNWKHLRDMLRFSVPLVPSSVAVFVYLYIDRIMINELMTLSDVGIFGIGYRVAAIINLLMFGFQGALTPLIYNYYTEPNTPADLARIFRYFVAAALLLCLGLALFAREFLAIFATPAYYDAAWVIPLLTPAVLLTSMYIFAPGVTIRKKTSLFAVINISGAILNTALNFTLIPALGIQGAALATFISASIIFSVHMAVSQRYYFVPYSWGRLALAAALVGILELIGLNMQLSLWTGVVFKMALVVLTLAIFVRAGLVTRGEILQVYTYAKRIAARLRPVHMKSVP